jgi:hypothetical protein
MRQYEFRSTRKVPRHRSGLLYSPVLSKLKCPVFLAHDMSGFIVDQQQSTARRAGILVAI